MWLLTGHAIGPAAPPDQHELLCPAVRRLLQMHNRELHWIANDQRLAKGAEGADPHKEETNTDRAGFKHPFGVDLGDAGIRKE